MRRPFIGMLAAMTAASCLAAGPDPWQKRITVNETTGTARQAWPVLVRLDPPLVDGKAPALRVFARAADGKETPVPSQVLAVLDPLTSERGYTNGPVELCFQADLKPDTPATFIVRASDGPNPEPAAKLSYEGSGFGLRVDSGPVQFGFDSLSGQFASYRPKMAGMQEDLFFKQVGKYRPCHWNPDVWVEGKPWGHTSDWNGDRAEMRPECTIDRGPLAFRMVRKGRLWSAESVEATVVYTGFAGMPFLLESSAMTFTATTTVKAVRHNELVFSRGFHTLAVWPGDYGKPRTTALYNKPDPKTFLGKVQTVSADAPWVALANDDRNYGIAIVNFWHNESAPDGLPTYNEKSCYYFLDYGDHGTGDHYDWNFAYVCRPLYYDDKAPVAIPAGARYREQSAFLAFGMGPDEETRFKDLLRWQELLRVPPVVTVE